MKRILSIFLIAVIMFLSSLLTFAIYDTHNNDYDDYEYEVTPKDDRWKSFTSRQEMLDAIKIEKDIVTKMKTEKLVQLVLDYPLLGDLGAYNTEELALKVLEENSDAYRELLTRNDAQVVFQQIVNKPGNVFDSLQKYAIKLISEKMNVVEAR